MVLWVHYRKFAACDKGFLNDCCLDVLQEKKVRCGCRGAINKLRVGFFG